MIIQESEPVKIWYLEMHKRKELRSKALPPDTQLVKFGTPLPAMNRFFYLEVGKKWQWTTRKSWTEQEWRDWADRKEIQTWMLLYQGTPAGYFELNTQEKDVELAYFGLLPPFLGKGLGADYYPPQLKMHGERKQVGFGCIPVALTILMR